jgi:hypothetical protein
MAMNEEFSFTESASFTPKAPVIQNQQLSNGIKLIARERQTGV